MMFSPFIFISIFGCIYYIYIYIIQYLFFFKVQLKKHLRRLSFFDNILKI